MVDTEFDATKAYAKAWNKLDFSEFIEMLAPNAEYASQWVLDELKNQEEISNYLLDKLEAVKNRGSPVFAELTKATISYPGKDCVALTHGDKTKIIGVVTFKVDEGKIQRFDMCIPDLFCVLRTENYPF